MIRIAVEGLKDDIVPLVCKILELETENCNICYRHESPYSGVDISRTKDIVDSKPDLVLICNAKGYIPFLKHYSEITNIPALVLTGGGPDLVEKVKEYVPNVLNVPFYKFQDLYDKINEILA